MAALAGCNDIQPNKIIKAVIHAGLDLDTNGVLCFWFVYAVTKVKDDSPCTRCDL